MNPEALQHKLEAAEEALKEANQEYKKAKESYKQAEQAYTEEWKIKNPNGSKTKLLNYLQRKCKTNLENLKGVLEAVKIREETYKTLLSVVSTAELTSIVLNCLKRVAEEDSSGSRKRSSGRNDTSFRDRLIERDECCVITGSLLFEASHIIPQSFFRDHCPVWVSVFEPFCADPSHEIDDVRNGLLLSPTLHTLFDKYLFTIVYENDKYIVKKSPFFPNPHSEEKGIQFKGNPSLFPSPTFLRVITMQNLKRETRHQVLIFHLLRFIIVK